MAIETIRPGDLVYSVDTATFKLVPVKVLSGPLGHPGTRILQVDFADGTAIRATSRHPFFDPASGAYKAIVDFAVGDRVVFVDERVNRTTGISAIRRLPDTETEVYNLTLDGGFHNFLAHGILVHNSDGTVLHSN